MCENVPRNVTRRAAAGSRTLALEPRDVLLLINGEAGVQIVAVAA